MKATYEVSEKDYISANRLCARLSSKFFLYVLLVSSVIIGCLLFVDIIPVTIQSLSSLASGLIFGLLFLALFHAIIHPLIAKSHYRKYPLMKDARFLIEMNDESISFEIGESKTKLIWKNILKWREDNQFILLFISPQQFYVIPKILSEQGFNIELLRKNLLDNIGNPK